MQQDPSFSSNSKSNSSSLKLHTNVNLNFSSSHRTHVPPTPPPLAFANANANSSSPSTTSSSCSIFIRNGAAAENGFLSGSHLEQNHHHHHHHRRTHSDVSCRLPDDLIDPSPSNPFNCGGSSTAGFEELRSEDDLFSTYIDVDKLGGGDGSATGSGGGENGSPDQSGNGNHNTVERDKSSDLRTSTSGNARPRHRHSCSVDGSISNSMFAEIMEAKKAMPPDKLVELWTIDPKRAKRILANRQSAARSKERKARYIQELERRVQTLQTEATTLSAQLTLFQRDTEGLSNENVELKLRLQAMEQQAHLRDSLNETLKKEVERLKVATGEMTTPSESFNMGMHQMPFRAANFFPLPPPAQAHGQETLQTPPFNHSQTNMSTYQTHQPSSHSLTDLLQNDQIGRLKGLDINSKGSALVKSETPSLSASESGTTF